MKLAVMPGISGHYGHIIIICCDDTEVFEMGAVPQRIAASDSFQLHIHMPPILTIQLL